MKTNYEKVIGWLAALILVGIIVWGIVSSNTTKEIITNNPPVTVDPIPTEQTPQTLADYLKAPMLSATSTQDWKTFSNAGFSIKYPKDFTVNTNYKNETNGPGQVQTGVSFTIPATLAAGTNLSKDSLISVEENSKVTVCEAKSFIDAGLLESDSQQTVLLNGGQYTVVTTGDAGAGNFYEQYIIAIPGPACRVVRMLIHSTNIGNYDPGTIKEFDKSALLSIYETMAASYKAK